MRDFALVRTTDQWLRAHHRGTALDAVAGEVTLRRAPPADEPASPDVREPGGLAFDRACRLYRSLSEAGQVERSFWRAEGGPAEVLFHGVPPPSAGGAFRPVDPLRAPLSRPTALAVDEDDQLFVLEEGAHRVLVYDLEAERLRRRVAFAEAEAPVDLAARGRTVWALPPTPGSLLRFGATRGVERIVVPLPPDLSPAARPCAIALSPGGRRFVLYDAGTAGAVVASPDWRARAVLPVPHATDLAFEADGTLVIARARGARFLRLRLHAAAWDVVEPGGAYGYDGRGLVATPDGGVGYWSDRGLLRSLPARDRYETEGTVGTYRLDAGEYQTVWGRLFLDGCVPEGTEVLVRFVTADEMPPGASLAPSPPADADGFAVRWPELTPPLLPRLFEERAERTRQPWQRLHRRDDARELPWSSGLPEGYATYEAPVIAPAGRFLWVQVRLLGNGRRAPRVRCLRVERPGHALLRSLPALFARDAEMADFLQRHLASPEGLLARLTDRADLRHAMLDPRSAPEEFLPWLAGFMGLALDPRWPVDRRRRLVAEAACLFRLRGTVRGLTRFLEICTARPVFVVEHFKTRGMGGAFGDEGGAPAPSAVLGGGFRVGGNLDEPAEATPRVLAERSAHRFTVVVAGALSDAERGVVEEVLEGHRPAHTLCTLCVTGRSMRVGHGLHVGLTSLVGEGARFSPAILDGVALDRGVVLGRARPGVSVDHSRLGRGTRPG